MRPSSYPREYEDMPFTGFSSTNPAPIIRPRRLRTTAAMRTLTAQTSIEPRNLILPLFVVEGLSAPHSIDSMPGVYQHTLDSLCQEVERAIGAGVGGVMLFGVPKTEDKDAMGSQALAAEGILNRAITKLNKEFGTETVIMADTCLDEFTDHGHCGILDAQGKVVNDATIEIYAQMALAQAYAGVQVVSPSGMMDGQIAAIRTMLDEHGFYDTAILAYTAKYASAFYGPFREAVSSSLQGDRRTYQQDVANRREALLELELDIAQGADMVMVKPAMSFLDIVSDIAQVSPVPIAAYQVSGEYSMICAASERGWINRRDTAYETLTSIRRAGADIILTYFAVEIAQYLQA